MTKKGYSARDHIEYTFGIYWHTVLYETLPGACACDSISKGHVNRPVYDLSSDTSAVAVFGPTECELVDRW